MLERKIRYNGTIAAYSCQLLEKQSNQAILSHTVPESFRFTLPDSAFEVPGGTITHGFYWSDRSYNIYVWRSPDGTFIGSYFNMVTNTLITDELVSYEDLI